MSSVLPGCGGCLELRANCPNAALQETLDCAPNSAASLQWMRMEVRSRASSAQADGTSVAVARLARDGYTDRPSRLLPCLVHKGCGVRLTGLSAWAASPGTRACTLLALGCAIAAGLALSVSSEADKPLYQRRAALEAACQDAGDALVRLHLPSAITFADDCRRPRVTALSNRPGHLVVTRVVQAQDGDASAGRTYSALMDGRHFDAWRLIEARPAPSELSVVHAPAALSTVGNLPKQ
jgi:hypothetical protein